MALITRKLLSVPENLTDVFHQIEQKSPQEWMVTSDPKGAKVGSGGGTAWLLATDWQAGQTPSFESYLSQNKKVLVHAGGQSRRLPAYAPSGKILTPIPVFRWSRGQRLNQNLLDLQLPLYERLMGMTAPDCNTLVASGDVLIMAPQLPAQLPVADVVCLGIWVDPHLASRHGVFFSPRHNASELSFMLQKPSRDKIEELTSHFLFMMDIGVWLLSDKAVNVLMRKCGWDGSAFNNKVPQFYDLYSTFGTCLGTNPSETDAEIANLTVAIVPLHNGEFYHYGTSLELITSTEKIQNRILDQRAILHHHIKPHPSLFVQNADANIKWTAEHHHIWIENSYVPSSWQLSHQHVITGVPVNDWAISLPSGVCVDIVPIGDSDYCLRPYGMFDSFSGNPSNVQTNWMGHPLGKWMDERGLDLDKAGFGDMEDIQQAALFPVVKVDGETGPFLQWMVSGADNEVFAQKWLSAQRLSANEISALANMPRLYAHRKALRIHNLGVLATNYHRSVFYQSDLKHLASEFAASELPLPNTLPARAPQMVQIQDRMFRSEVARLRNGNGVNEEREAFGLLRDLITSNNIGSELPNLNVYADQIVWGRSPVRLDLAGGWTDTPPYCIQNGGKVVNMAVNLNGQPPLQVFIRLSEKPVVVLRSIDNGVSEEISTFEELAAYDNVGSAFSIPRAALCLAGFHPKYCKAAYKTLKEQLSDFGGGLEISLLAAVPKGSGLGTSSILAATLLGALSDFCALNWDKQAICHRTSVLEQLLTTGGGWQDQYGGIIGGIKLLETEAGPQDNMLVRYLPDTLFTSPDYSNNWLLYYTGITRVAKNILSEIVRGMFLNDYDRLQVLSQIGTHASNMYDAIQKNDFQTTAALIERSWLLNKTLDAGTNTVETQMLIDRVSDYSLGMKLLGAGGGGYMLICAKDPSAAQIIKQTLTQNPINSRARFVKMDVNKDGFQVTRS
jgi:galactokinase/mevalonate kinase-like predicted kinase